MSPTQLQDELERSFGDGPERLPVGTHLAAGRRALRRRRTATAACAAVLVLGVGYAVTGPGSSERTTSDIANDPTPAPPAAEAGWEGSDPVRYRDGVLEVRPGVVVHQRIDKPYGYPPPKASAALDVTFNGVRTWNIAELTRRGAVYSAATPSNGWASFEDWVAGQTDLTTGGDDGWPDTLRLTDQGDVVATPGTEVLQRTDDPQLGDTFAGQGEPTGAALVRTTEDGQSYFVVWRVIDGDLDVITTPPADVPGASFPELLTYARGKYASGEGLR
jgi:hypothetical protein